MALPEVLITVQDPNLGIVPESIDGVTAAIGICSKGTAATVYNFSDKQALKDALGVGPLVEHAAHILDVAGGPIRCVRAAQAVAGAAGAVTKSGTGPDVTVSGAAADAYDVIVKIILGGAVATATFQYSLDNGDTYSPEIVTAATYVVPDTGLTLAFAAGTYVAADTYSFACTAPLYDATTLAAALDGLLASPLEWRFVAIVGQAASASAAATLAGTVSTKMASAKTNYRYARAFMHAADTDANLISGFAAFADDRVIVCAGHAELGSSLTGRPEKRASLTPICARAAKAPVHEDLGRVASGSLPGVTSLYRDERVTEALDSQRFATLRSFVGLNGYYITAGRTMAAKTSDFQHVQNGFVIDKACRALRNGLLAYLNDSVRVNATSGFIFEEDAQAIEADLQGQLEAAIIAPGNASSVEVKVKRDENILSTQNLTVTVSVVPLGYARSISASIGLKNPALTPVAA